MEKEIETSKEVEVDGIRYLITHPQVEIAWDIGVELLKLVGGSASSMATAAGNEDKAGEALTKAVVLFLQKLEAKASFALMRRILASVEVQGEVGGHNKKVILNESGIKLHFHGKIGSMMKLTGEVIAFTHADFFEAIVGGIATLMNKAQAIQA